MNIQTPSSLPLAAAILLAATLSCSKETGPSVPAPDDIITVSVGELDTRSTLDGLATYWSEGDSIILFDTDDHSATYEFLEADTDPGKATFIRKPGGTGFLSSKFAAAFYPAEYFTSYSSGTFTADIPATLTYAADTLRAPMASNSYDPSTKTLTFANAFAVINLSVYGVGTVSSIELSSDSNALSGSFDFALSGTNVVTLNPPTFSGGSNDKITLNCGSSGVALTNDPDAAVSFLIPVPAPVSGEPRLTATVNCGSGKSKVLSATMNTADSTAANYYHQNYIADMTNIYIPGNDSDDLLLPGVFTAWNDGTKVRFSRGNLQATYNGSGYDWSIAKHQYDYIGNASGNVSIDNPQIGDVVDLFGWSTASTNFGISTSQNASTYSGDFKDWGTALDSSGEWITLENAWNYIANYRSVGGYTGSGHSYQKVTSAINIEGIPFTGLILFPDGFTKQSTWQTEYTTWKQINDAGLVFLPNAGQRTGSTVSDVGTKGYYWSYALHMVYGPFYLETPEPYYYNYSRNYGHSVRLVKYAE